MTIGDQRCVLIYGGTFDPPHLAHVTLPIMAAKAVGAESVVYVPAGVSPHKTGAAQTSSEHRLAMLRLALAETPGASISTLEIDRAASRPDRPSYTVDTLEQFHEQWGDSVKMRLLIGGDQLRVFDRWWMPARIVELADPVVMVRPPDTQKSLLAELPEGFDAAEWEKRLLDLPLLDISATAIRERARKGLPITGMVHPKVEEYIRRNGLYR